MTRKDRKVVAVALATLTVCTAVGFHTVNQKAKEFEASMTPTVIETEVETTTEAETTTGAETTTETETTTEAPSLRAVCVTAKSIPGASPETETETETETEPQVYTTDPQNLGTFKLTAYCACPQCCGAWSDGITYTGTVATAGRTIAVDPSVIPLGSTVYINDHAYIAEDTGGAIKGNRIDVFFTSHAEALNFGIQYATVSL